MRRTIITLIFCLAVASCGQKGPLYLPGEPPATFVSE